MAHKYIHKVETIEFHYSNTKKSRRRYLPNGMTKKKWWRNHQKKMKKIGIPCVEYETFRKIFRLYNIGKTPPKADVCNFCTITRNIILIFLADVNTVLDTLVGHLQVMQIQQMIPVHRMSQLEARY